MALAYDASTVYQGFEGCGVDLAVIPSGGISDAVADMLFSTNPAVGIGLQRCRLRQSVVDGSFPSTLGGYDNSGQVASAVKAAARGAKFWALADSNTFPSQWLSTSGGYKVFSPTYYDAWATGCAQMPAKAAAQGITLDLISMGNEPDNPGVEPHLTGSVLDTLALKLGPQLSAGVKLMLPELTDPAGSGDGTLATYADPTLNDATARAYVGRCATHVYRGGPSGPYATAESYGIPTWQTEYNPGGANDVGMTSALTVAQKIHACFATARYSMFGYFLVAGLPGWTGSTYGILGDSYADTKRRPVLGHFSLFIPVGGWRVAATGAPAGVLATGWAGPSGARVIVAINTNASPTALDVSGLAGVPSVTPWITDATRSLAHQTDAALSGGSFSYSLPAQSVMTFVGVSQSAGATAENIHPVDAPDASVTPAGRLTLGAGPVQNGIITLGGYRIPGSTVTATVG